MTEKLTTIMKMTEELTTITKTLTDLETMLRGSNLTTIRIIEMLIEISHDQLIKLDNLIL